MAKAGEGLTQYLKAFEKAVDKALEDVGRVGVEYFQADPNIEDRIFTGRLADSMSWATPKKSSGVGGRAVSSDQIPRPTEPHSLNVGTNCPYAIVHQEGYATKSFQFGKDGNPDSHEELVEKLKIWCATKGIDESMADSIACKIESGDIRNYPFYDAVRARFEQDVGDVFWDSFKIHMPMMNITEKI